MSVIVEQRSPANMSEPDNIVRKWIITETFRDDGESEVAATPSNWIKSGTLLWPRDLSKKTLSSKLESCSEPTKNWKVFKNFEILENGNTYGKLKQTVCKKNT